MSRGGTGDLKHNTVQPNGLLIADSPGTVWLAAFNQRVAVPYITSTCVKDVLSLLSVGEFGKIYTCVVV